MKKAVTLVLAMIFVTVTGLATAQGSAPAGTPAATKSDAPKLQTKAKKAKPVKKAKKARAKTGAKAS